MLYENEYEFGDRQDMGLSRSRNQDQARQNQYDRYLDLANEAAEGSSWASPGAGGQSIVDIVEGMLSEGKYRALLYKEAIYWPAEVEDIFDAFDQAVEALSYEIDGEPIDMDLYSPGLKVLGHEVEITLCD